MDALQGQVMASCVEARRCARIRAMDAAPRRLAEGEFDFCGECGEFIGEERLDLDPVVMRCVGCL